MRVLVAGIRKLLPRPATYVTAGILLGLLALVFLAVGATAKSNIGRPGGEASLLLLTFPGAYANVLGFILGFGGLMAVVYGAAIAGSEWSWGTLKTAVARGEGRIWYTLFTFGSVAVLCGIGLLVAFVVGVLVAVLGANLAGVPTDGLSDSTTLAGIPEHLLRGWLAIAEEGALGFAIATIARSQLAGIGAGIAIYFGEQFAGIFLGDIVKYLPFNAATAVISTTVGDQGGGVVSRLDPNAALLVVVVWLVGALVVSSAITERADIGG